MQLNTRPFWNLFIYIWKYSQNYYNFWIRYVFAIFCTSLGTLNVADQKGFLLVINRVKNKVWLFKGWSANKIQLLVKLTAEMKVCLGVAKTRALTCWRRRVEIVYHLITISSKNKYLPALELLDAFLRSCKLISSIQNKSVTFVWVSNFHSSFPSPMK